MSTVFALATPPAKSAICVFRVSGNGCHKQLKELLNNKSFDVGRFQVRGFYNDGVLIDKAGLLVFEKPNSYTGEDSFEVYAHGSLGVMSSLIKLFKSVGFEEAIGGEFTKRAFLNNKISLNEAESIADLIDSTEESGVVLSSNSLFGDMSNDIVSFANEIDQIRVRVEAEIDFSDEGEDYIDESLVVDLKNVKNRFDLFIGGCINKKLFSQKNNILLVGPVNSGKSSVFNRLLGFERAIVSDVPGTTRDIVSSELFYESVVFSVFDSAGIRETKDVVEKAGIGLSMAEIDKADLVIGVFEEKDIGLVKWFGDRCVDVPFISVQNKIDINVSDDVFFDCCVSAKTGDGFDCLKGLIASSFKRGSKNEDYKYIIRDRHEELFKTAVGLLGDVVVGLEEEKSFELLAEDLKIARGCLDELVGKKFSDSLLGDIFNSYCIGK
jgi:tRNA modification GTPase